MNLNRQFRYDQIKADIPGEEPFNISIITATHHRPDLLRAIALPSLLNQTFLDFEWVVINDGRDLTTRDLLTHSSFPFRTRYIEIDHPQDGFGLCMARNLGIDNAHDDLVCYLDDDNELRPEFINSILSWFDQHPKQFGCLPQQWRRRDVLQEGQVVKSGKPFISPHADTTIADLIAQRSLFDSNGFTHRRQGAPPWNPDYRVFCDYEFFLQCISAGHDIGLYPQVLVDYIQTSEGEIGRSNYGQWAQELQQLYSSRLRYDGIAKGWADWMPEAIDKYQDKAQVQIPGFRR